MSEKRYIINTIEEFDSANKSTLFHSPTLILVGGVMLCTSGECEISVNAKSYSVKRWDLIVVSPYSIIQVMGLSDDFDCIVIGASLDLLSRIELPNKGKYFINISSHPSISLTEIEANEIIRLQELLRHEERNNDRPFFAEVRDSMLKIIAFKVFALYNNREPNREHTQSRDREILNIFIVDLLKYNHMERKLEFYANRQSITPSYMSRCVKSITGKGASEILIESVINNIKYRLTDHSISIYGIAEEFHFSSSSSLSQYFKKYTSLSPKEYRRRVVSTL